MSMLASSGTEFVRAEVVPEDELVPEFDDLYRQNFRFTWSVLRRLGVPEAAIEDAAQEVWVIVHRRLDALESPRAARSWLFQISRRVAARHRRGEQRSQRKINALRWVAPRRSQPHAERDSMLTVESLLEGIDARKREAFVLSELEGWSAPEIAKAAGTNPNTVYSRIRLARAELRAGWEAGDPTLDFDVALGQMKSGTRPPRGAAKRCWMLLAPKLAVGSKAAVGSVGMLAGWKLYVAGTVALGLAAAGGSVLERESGPGDRPAAVAAAAETPSSDAPAPHSDDAPGADATEVTPESIPSSAVQASVPEAKRDAPSSETTRRSRAGSPSKAPVQAAAGSGLADETGLLSAAQTSLAGGRPERALEQLAEHRTRFADSALADLRLLLEIKALCAAERVDDARAALRRAEATMSGSALLPKMRRACGE